MLHAAASVFERRGYAAATIAEILSEGNVTKGAAYFHFESKEALARAIVAEQAEWRSPDARPGSASLQHVVDLVYRFARALETDVLARASVRLTLERNTFERHPDEPDQYQAWIDDIRPHLDAADSRGELTIPPEAATHIIVSAVAGTQVVSEALTNRADLVARIHTFWTTLAPGMISAKSRRRIDLRPLAERD